jgi:UDP-GlcNAc:undecaprenyl-phosphate/decaprenyl-phosphate GlcNAc-1-phosphate transferase
MYEKIFILFVIVNTPIVLFYKQLVQFIDINDAPDKVRKLQKDIVPLFGGILIVYNLIIFFVTDIFFNLNNDEYFFNTREYFVFFTGIFGCFSIGLYDDKYDLPASKKLFLNTVLIFLLVLIDESLLISNLLFSFNSNPIELRNLSYPFTVLCVLLLINALNMFDGINLQVGSYCILILILLFINELYIFINIILILSLILFLIYNYFNKAYLGDAGTQVLAFIISYVLIKSQNVENNIRPDYIFIILSFPGLDMFRLFLSRIIKGKHPFKADRNHMHHLISRKFSPLISFFLIQFVIITNLVIYYFLDNKIFSIIFTVLLYIIMVLIFKKNNFEKII